MTNFKRIDTSAIAMTNIVYPSKSSKRCNIQYIDLDMLLFIFKQSMRSYERIIKIAKKYQNIQLDGCGNTSKAIKMEIELSRSIQKYEDLYDTQQKGFDMVQKVLDGLREKEYTYAIENPTMIKLNGNTMLLHEHIVSITRIFNVINGYKYNQNQNKIHYIKKLINGNINM